MAGFGNHFAGAITGGAGGYLYHGAQEGVAYLADFTAPAAGFAAHLAGARLCAAALAVMAHFVAGDLNLTVDAGDHFFEVKVHGICQVLPAPGRIAPTSAPAGVEPEQPFEQIGEKVGIGEIRHVAHAVQAGVPVAVVSGTLFGVREDTVGLVDFLEAFFGVRCFVHIRVVLAR